MQVPSVNSAACQVASASDDVCVCLLLLLDELRNEFGLNRLLFQNTYMMREISVHEDYEISSCLFQAINISTSQTHLSRASEELDLVLSVNSLQILDHILSSIGRVVVHDDYFHVKLPKNC